MELHIISGLAVTRGLSGPGFSGFSSMKYRSCTNQSSGARLSPRNMWSRPGLGPFFWGLIFHDHGANLGYSAKEAVNDFLDPEKFPSFPNHFPWQKDSPLSPPFTGWFRPFFQRNAGWEENLAIGAPGPKTREGVPHIANQPDTLQKMDQILCWWT
jgi:hypothetical protein